MNYNPNIKIYVLKDEYKINTQSKRRIRTNFILLDYDGVLTIYSGYAWNGASPKFSLFDMVFGTPEGIKNKNDKPKTYYPTLVHDALYQLSTIADIGNRKNADKLFYDMLRKERFKSAKLYYIIVRLLGWKYWGK